MLVGGGGCTATTVQPPTVLVHSSKMQTIPRDIIFFFFWGLQSGTTIVFVISNFVTFYLCSKIKMSIYVYLKS